MSKSIRGRLNVVRWATGLGVLAAFPFLASGVAQAAMAGGNPLTTTNRPDLRSVHVVNAGTGAQFCFDKAISNSAPQGGSLAVNAARFRLGGYRFDVANAALTVGVDTTNTNCAVATMANGDLNSYSFGTVQDNTVISNAGGSGAQGNIGDSTANLDSNSHSGTADHTQGPDLQAVVPDLTNNRLVYTFDQPVDGATATAGRYLFYDSNGNAHFGAPIGTSGSQVLVQFLTTTDPISAAKVATVIRGVAGSEGQPQNAAVSTHNNCVGGNGAVCESGLAAGQPETTNPTESVAVPGTSGLTARPTLLSAALVPGPSNQIDYTFSVPISAGTASDLVAVTSNGQEEQATSETIISANTVRATFSAQNLQNFQELVVKASAYGCAPGSPLCVNFAANNVGNGAVQSVNLPGGATTRFNITGGVAVGGNVGAFATGFSTGPDARSVTFDNATGTVTVQMDQRVDPAGVTNNGCSGPTSPTAASGNLSGGCWVLLDNTGAVVDPVPLSAAVVNNSPFQSQVRLTYPPSDLARATSLAIAGPTVDATAAGFTYDGLGYDSQGTVRQVISPTASATAFLDPAKKVSTKYHAVSKRQRAAGLALLHRLHRKHHRAAHHR